MPENHSVSGNWHSGKKGLCVKCGYIPPAPVVEVIKEVIAVAPAVKKTKSRKKKVV